MKLLAGDDQELLQIIPSLLGCNKQSLVEGESIDMIVAGEAVELMKETAFSHLMEVSNLLIGLNFMYLYFYIMICFSFSVTYVLFIEKLGRQSCPCDLASQRYKPKKQCYLEYIAALKEV